MKYDKLFYIVIKAYYYIAFIIMGAAAAEIIKSGLEFGTVLLLIIAILLAFVMGILMRRINDKWQL